MSAPVQPVESVTQRLKKDFKTRYLEDLKRLVRIPSVSFAGYDPKQVKRSAQAVSDLMQERGLENVRILEMPGVHPYVYGDWLKAGPGAPTLLLYAHHDVQPSGRDEVWESNPFEPTLREGPGGERLYARGAADDKAGIIVHVAAVESFLKTHGKLPVNVKIIIEGEEETGSTHLGTFLKEHRKLLDADVLVLTDTSNFNCGVPALTVALRGLVEIEVELRGLKGSIHSGMWGGPVPDPAMALCKVLSHLTDEAGQIAVPGLTNSVRPVTEGEQFALGEIPYIDEEFKKQSGMVETAHILRHPRFPNINPAVQVWRLPSLTINAIQASSRQTAGNIINDTAWSKVTVRVVADMDPELTGKKLVEFIRSKVPWGLEARVDVKGASGAWATEATGYAFDAADVALEKGYGHLPLKIGCGGSIPFVRPFADALGGAPAILIGVEDPYTNAHGENESLLVSDLEKACVSQVYFFEEIAKRWNRKSK